MYADSAHEPEASRFEAYKELSKRTHESRLAVADPASPDAAAVEIVDAILDDDSPLRVSCDPVGKALWQGRNSMSDEDWFTTLFKSLAKP